MERSEDNRHCEATKQGSGKPCEGFRSRVGRFCSVHNPANAAAMKEAQRRGGQTRMAQVDAKRFLETSEFQGKSVGEVGDLLAETINHVRTGQIDTRVGTAIGYLANILIRARETADLEQRIEKLEEVQTRMTVT